jgi:cytoskeletal protein CcmA (bactofilin family)
MRKLLATFAIIFVSLLSFTQVVQAADLRRDETITIRQEGLSNLYLFGEKITVDVPVDKDIVAAGGNLYLNGDITGGLLAAGGNIDVQGTIGNSIRAAGGNVTIDGTVEEDVVLAGGNIRLTRNARVNGDLIITGGSIDIESPVQGKVIVNGGDVTINSTIGADVDANAGELTLGSSAVINGNLNYRSEEEARIAQGARVTGKTNFTPSERVERQVERGWQQFASGLAFFSLISSIIFGLLLLWLLRRFLSGVFTHITESPVASSITGLIALIAIPLISLILLALVFPGIAGFIFYALLLIISGVVASLFAGYYVLRWWYNRSKREYTIDWKTAVVGPIIVYLLSFIPIIGGLIKFLLFLLALGGIVRALLRLRETRVDGDQEPKRSDKPQVRSAKIVHSRASRAPARSHTTTHVPRRAKR